jgi:hypothetical protein
VRLSQLGSFGMISVSTQGDLAIDSIDDPATSALVSGRGDRFWLAAGEFGSRAGRPTRRSD